MLPDTAHRTERVTHRSVNEDIRERTMMSIRRCAAGGPQAISRRLAELDQEWDIERVVETLSPSLTLLGLTLGLQGDRRWFALPIAVQTFLLQHALFGWCPPVPFLRRLGVRTQPEIEAERYALKALRGDFEGVSRAGGRVDEVIEAVQH